MSEIIVPKETAVKRRTLGATLWFLWIVGMWATFFALLLADKLDGLWGVIRDLPVVSGSDGSAEAAEDHAVHLRG